MFTSSTYITANLYKIFASSRSGLIFIETTQRLQRFFGIAYDGRDPCLARELAGILTYRPELLEAWLELTNINYNRNVWVSILLYLWLALTMLRANGPWVITQFIFNVIQQLVRIQIYFSKE